MWERASLQDIAHLVGSYRAWAAMGLENQSGNRRHVWSSSAATEKVGKAAGVLSSRTTEESGKSPIHACQVRPLPNLRTG